MFNLNLVGVNFLLCVCLAFPLATSGAQTNAPMSARLHLEVIERKGVPYIASASDEARLALKRFRLPAGFSAHVFASEPMLANPVAFCLDEQCRVFVAETHRF